MRTKTRRKTRIGPVRTERDYDRALKAIAQYFEREPKRGTSEADRFDVLAALIESYEAKRWPIDPPGDDLVCSRAILYLK